jgi:hypothetical protein
MINYVLYETSVYNFDLNKKMTKVFCVARVLQNSALRV